jgi:hypothetical protein
MWGGGGTAPSFLTLALDVGEWLASRSRRFPSGERAPGTHCIRGWLGPWASLGAVKETKFLQCMESNPGNAGRSQPLYRLSYPHSTARDMGKHF